MPMPAKRIQLLLPVPSSSPRSTRAMSSTRSTTISSFHCWAIRSTSITVKSTKAMMPIIMEPICTARYLEGSDMFQPPSYMPVTAFSIMVIPKMELIMHMHSRKISARLKKSFM